MDWVAGIVELMAKFLVGNHKWYGHTLHIVAGMLWSVVAVATETYGLLVITVPAFFLNVRNAFKWYKEKKNA